MSLQIIGQSLVILAPALKRVGPFHRIELEAVEAELLIRNTEHVLVHACSDALEVVVVRPQGIPRGGCQARGLGGLSEHRRSRGIATILIRLKPTVACLMSHLRIRISSTPSPPAKGLVRISHHERLPRKVQTACTAQPRGSHAWFSNVIIVQPCPGNLLRTSAAHVYAFRSPLARGICYGGCTIRRIS